MTKKVIRGSGGSKGGGGGTEMADNLRSKQVATVVDALCEGPIVGLVNGLRSIYLNETVLMNDDGTGLVADVQFGSSNANSNFVNVSAQWRNGTQDQLPLEGVADVEFETIVQQEVKAAVPIIRTLNNTICNNVRVTVAVPMLTDQNKENGDLRGSAVSFKIDIRANGGSWVTKVNDTIKGKTTSKYQRAFMIGLDQAGPWDVRVTRTTPDSTSVAISNSIYFDSMTGIIDSKLSYPNTALVAMRIDSSQFQTVPQRAYGIKGLIISVPTNYNPDTRVYNGVWDGTFKQAWTDNPAWCFYDLLTARRYGLGDVIPASSVDKWSLYTIAQYCDQLVDSGYKDTNGNPIMEPRFTCNLMLQSAEEAYTVIQNFASIFRAITYWGAGSIIAMQDRPADPVALYTNANTIDGMFTYTGASLKQRHTVALVSWNDPKDFYRQKVEYVQDDDGVKMFGVLQAEMVALGCASKGQAHRMGKWLLATEKLATETVSFKTGLDGATLYPGAIINTSDVMRAGTRMGGRIASATTTAVTLDADVVLAAGQAYTLSVVSPTGTLLSRPVSNAAGTYRTLNLATAMTETPQENSVFILTASNLKPESWRVIGVKEADDNQIEVNAIAHIPELFASVEQGVKFEATPISAIKVKPDAPTGLNLRVSRYQLNGGMVGMRATLGWEADAPSYRVRYRRTNGAWEQRNVSEPSLDIDNLDVDTYEFEVTAISSIGRESDSTVLSQAITPENITLTNVTGLVLEGAFTESEAKFKWDAVPGATSYEVQMKRGDTSAVVRTVNVGAAQRFEYTTGDMRADGGPWRSLKIAVRALGAFGAASQAATEITATNPQVGALTGVAVDAGVLTAYFTYARPADPDFAGVQVWLGTTSGFTPGPTNLAFDGLDTSVLISKIPGAGALVGGTTYYIKYAGYDAFGKDSLTISGPVAVTPLANAQLSNNSITAAMLQDGILDVAKFASGIEPVKIVTSVPSVKSTSVIYNSTDGFQYRWNGTAYVKSIPTTDLTGTINDAQIAALSATKLSGTLTDAQLAAISASKVTGTLTNAQIAALDAAKITGTLSDAQIAAISAAKLTGQITGTQITDGSISTAKISAGAVTASQIAADTITAAQIAANAITATELAAGSVTTAKLVANAVTANEIAAGSVTTAKLVAGAVTANEIAASTITAGNIAAGAITTPKIAAGAITANEIAAQQIIAKHLVLSNPDAVDPDPGFYDPSFWAPTANGTWPSGMLPDATSGSSWPAARALLFTPVGAKLSNVSRTFPSEKGAKYRMRVHIFKNTGTAGNFQFNLHIPGDSYHPIGIPRTASTTGIDYGTNIDWASIPNAAWTTYTTEITGSAYYDYFQYLSSGTLTAGALYVIVQFTRMASAELIVDGSISAAKITANAINATHIAADAVTAGKIAAAAISAREIAAGAITTNKLAVISQGNAINDDPNLEDYANAWVASSGIGFGGGSVATGNVGMNYVTSAVPNVDQIITSSRRFTVDPYKTYRATANLYNGGSTRVMWVFVNFYDVNGSRISTSWGGTMSGYVFGAVPTQYIWAEYGGNFGGTVAGKGIPANAKTMEIGVWFLYSGSGDNTAGNQYAQNIRLVQVVGGTLIEDGAITTNKITAGAITSGLIAANAVTADKIAAGTITADKVSVTSLSAFSTNFGNVHVNPGGALHGGAFSAYAWPASGSGFYLGTEGLLLGNPNTGPYMQLTADGQVYSQNFTINSSGIVTIANATVTNPTLDAFSVSGLTAINLTSRANTTTLVAYGTVTATPVNGKAPFTYSWVIQLDQGNRLAISSTTAQTVTISGSGQNVYNIGSATCTVKDANGRVAIGSVGIQVQHGTGQIQ